MYDKDFFIELANKYETKDFIKTDPIQFPRIFCEDTDFGVRFEDKRDVEISAFITSWLSYGSREQIIKTAGMLHTLMDYEPLEYLMKGEWRKYEYDLTRLYRFYIYRDFFELLRRMYAIYTLYNSLEDAVLDYPVKDKGYIYPLEMLFKDILGIPEFWRKSACKRLAMFLRWMIRRDSPVDIGIWERCQPEKLIIPLDTHVHQQALKLGITKRKSANMRTAKEITDYFNDIFPGDPARGDFALFGYGINNA